MDAVQLAPSRRVVLRVKKMLAGAGHLAIEWGVFLTMLVVFSQTLRGQMRLSGPAVLLVATGIAIACRLRRRRDLRLIAMPLLAGLGGLLLRQTESASFGHWLGRGCLLAGTGFTALLWIPNGIQARLRLLFNHLTARPSGVLAHLIALFGIAVPACVLFLSDDTPRGSGDTIPVVATIERELHTGTRDLSSYAAYPRNGRWNAFVGQNPPYNMHPTEYEPGLFTAYPAGMEVFAWPVTLAALARGADLTDDGVQARIEYRTAAAVSALALALFFLAAACITDARAAYALTAALAVGSAFFTTFGHSLWQQGGVVFWALVVLLVEVRRGGRPGWLGAIVQGIACGLMLSCRTSAVTLLVPFGVWVLVRDWKRGLLVPFVAAVAYLPFLVMYWRIHHSLVGPSHILAAGMRWPTWESAAGVLASPSRGLLVYQPVLLLLPLAIVARFRSRTLPGGFYPYALVAGGLQVLLAASWFMWWGGHCIGSRLVSEAIPALALAVAPVVGRMFRTTGGRAAFAAIAVVGLMMHHNMAYYYGSMTWNVDPVDVDLDNSRLWDWTRPPFLYVPGKS